MTSRSARRQAMVPPPKSVTDIAADAYGEAARLGAAMLRAVEIIEPLRLEAARATDAYLLARSFDAAVAITVNESLLPVIMKVRDSYLAAVADQLRGIVANAFEEGTEAGLRTWLRGFAEALTEFELTICQRLTEPGCVPADLEERRIRLAQAVLEARRARWHLVYPIVTELLAENFFDDVERALLLALESDIEFYFFNERHKAELLAENALHLAPDESRAAEVVARTRRHCGRRAEAEQILRSRLERDPHCDGFHIEYSKCARDSGEIEEAEKRLLEGLQQAPHSADVYLQLLDLYSRPELFTQREYRLSAIAAQASAIDPDSAYDAQVTLAIAYENNDALDRAQEILKRTIDAEPSRVNAIVELAECRRRDHDLVGAKHELDRALSIDSQSVGALDLYTRLYEEEEDREQAIGWAMRLVEATPGNRGTAFARLAALQFETGDLKTARSTALKAVRCAPTDDQVLDLLQPIVEHDWRGSAAEAVRAMYAPALEARGAPEYHNLLGHVAYDAGDYAGAADEYREAVKLAADNAAYRRYLADAQSRLGQWDDALRSLDAALSLDKDEATYKHELSFIRNDRANAAYSEDRYADALPDYEEAVRLNPDDAVMHSNLAQALRVVNRKGQRAKDLQWAAAELTKAADLDHDYVVALAQVQGELENVRRFGELIESPSVIRPIMVEVAQDLVPKFDPQKRGGNVFSEDIPALRSSLREALGFWIPGVRIRPGELPSNGYRILLREVVMEAGSAVPDHECVLADPAHLVNSEISAGEIIAGRDPLTGKPCAWVPPGYADQPGLESFLRLTDVGFVLRHLRNVVRRNAARLFDLDAAEEWILEVRPPAKTPADERRSAAEQADDQLEAKRRLSVSRALRAFVQDGVRLDASLLANVEETVDARLQDPANACGAAVAAVSHARLAFRDRLPGIGREPYVTLPEWAEKQILSQGGLTAMEQFEIFRSLLPITEERRNFSLVVEAPSARGYVRQLVSDFFGSVIGLDIAVVTRPETEIPPQNELPGGG